MAETLAETGIDGFDLTVRPGGRVEPERVKDDLPKIIEIGNRYNLKTEMMVTAITSVSEPHSTKVLETAAKNGIKHYRLGYYDYNFKNGITNSLAVIKMKLDQLALLNKEIGIQGGYQNHAGSRFGAPVWDIWHLVKDIQPEYISCQFDIRHAIAEGNSSWIIALHLLGKNIGSLPLKDFTIQIIDGKIKYLNVPLGEGIVDFNLFFKTIKDLKIEVPLSLHIEYPLLSKEDEKLSLLQKQEIIISKIKKDVEFIRLKLNQ